MSENGISPREALSTDEFIRRRFKEQSEYPFQNYPHDEFPVWILGQWKESPLEVLLCSERERGDDE